MINRKRLDNNTLTTKEKIKNNVEKILSRMIMESGETVPFKKSHCIHMYLMWGYEWLTQYLMTYAFPKLDKIGPKKTSKKKIRLRLLNQLQRKNAKHYPYVTYPRKYLEIRTSLDKKLRTMIYSMTNGKQTTFEPLRNKNIGKGRVRCNFNDGRDF